MLTKVSKNGKLTQCLEYIFMYPHFLFLSFKKETPKMAFISQNFPISFSKTNCHKTIGAYQTKKQKNKKKGCSGWSSLSSPTYFLKIELRISHPYK